MATLYMLLAALQAQVSAVTRGLISNSPDTEGLPLPVQVGLYWPSAKTLQDNVRKNHAGTGAPSALVTVYDRGLSRDSTRWLPQTLSSTVSVPILTVTASAKQVPPYGVVTLTFTDPNPTDAVGIVLVRSFGGGEAVVAIAGPGDTAATMAAQTVSLMMSDLLIPGWVRAAASGNVVTLTSVIGTPLPMQVNIGGVGTRVREIGRRMRHCQIVVWARTPDDRSTVADPIEQMIAVAEADFGLAFPDGSLGRMCFYGDIEHDEATLSDTLRRDFLVGIDYPITTTDATYSILAPIVRNTTF